VHAACTRNKNGHKILGGKLERLGLIEERYPLDATIYLLFIILRTTRLRWEINIQKHRKINEIGK